jgi:hypothetical protein
LRPVYGLADSPKPKQFNAVLDASLKKLGYKAQAHPLDR